MHFWRFLNLGLALLINLTIGEVEGSVEYGDDKFVSWLIQRNYSIPINCEGVVVFDETDKLGKILVSNGIENSAMLLHSVESFQTFLGHTVDLSERICLLVVPKDLESCWTVVEHIIKFNRNSPGGKFKPWNPMAFILWPTILDRIDEIPPVLGTGVPPEILQNLHVNSDLYFVFQTRSKKLHSNYTDDNNPHYKVSVWEAYAFKGQKWSIINQIKSPSRFHQKLIRRGNFRGAEIVAVAAEDMKTKTEVDWVVGTRNSVRFTSGFSVSILKDLRDTLNFTDRHVLGDWIQQYPNDSIKGKTVDYLYSGRADLMIGHTTMLPLRAAQLQYLQPTFFNSLKVFLQQPPLSSVQNMFLAPFRSDLWASLISTWLIIVGFMFIFQMVKTRVENDENTNTDTRLSAGEVLLWSVGLACQQGWYKEPKTTSIRIIFLAGAACGMIINMAYTAAIVSVLSVENIPIKNLNSFFQSELPMFVSADSSFLKQFVNILYKERPKLRQKGSPFLPISEGVKKVFQKPVAFLSYGHLFHFECQSQNISDQERCRKIYSFPITTSPRPGGMLVPKNSIFVEIFNYRIIQLKEKGYISRSTRHFNLASSLDCLRRFARYRETIGIQDTFTAHAVLISGHCLSLVLLLIEKACFIIVNRIGFNNTVLN